MIETFMSLARAAGHEPLPLITSAHANRSAWGNDTPNADALFLSGEGTGDIRDTGWYWTDSGENVTPNTAYNFAAVQAAHRLLSEVEASFPCHLCRRSADGRSKERAFDNYLYPLLHDSPNDEQTSFQFWQTMRQNRASWGNAYALLKWSSNNRWTQFIPLRPDWMKVGRNSNGVKVYEYRPGSGQPYEGNYISSDLIHVRGMGDDLTGWSPIKLMRQNIGWGLAAARSAAAFYKNGARPSGVLTMPGKIQTGANGEPSEAEETFQKRYAGAHNTGRTLIIGDGARFVTTTIPPEDAQYLETIKDAGRFVWMVYGIPPHLLGDTEKSTSWGTGIEQQVLGFQKFVVRPSLEMTQQEFEYKLLGRGERELFIEFDMDGLLQADANTRAQVLAVKRQNGIINADEWRALDNQNPIGGEEGSAYLVNGTMIPVRVALQKTATPTNPQQPQ